MELDFATYLRLARPMFLAATEEWERPIKRDDFLLNDYLNLMQTLTNLAAETKAFNPNLVGNKIVAAEPIKNLFAKGLVQFLLVSLKQQWTHLMVLEQDDLEKLKKFPQRHLNHQYIGLMTMVLNSYHQKRQSDFAHAWRSYLKLGIFELEIDSSELNELILAQLTNGNK
ncbi:dUTPase [Weissella coleopterorum]|uniref:dUTPase n=1 Tax=Weissella coleopterorum TaxID=2714949 RepID=A0A6G8B1H8_9LACO|nr:dUTPase [Weissella coleopterorum]QIL51106.1 dUTPase [Weissella coleopterorum]